MKFEIEIASVPDREGWVVEIWNERVMVAEVVQRANDSRTIEFFVPSNQSSLILDFTSLRDAIEQISKYLSRDVIS